MTRTIALLSLFVLVAACALLGPFTERSGAPPAPSPPVVADLSVTHIPLPSPLDDPLPALCAPEAVLPEVLPMAAMPSITMTAYSAIAALPPHPIFAPDFPETLPPSPADPACAPQTVALPEMSAMTAEEVANALDKKVKVQEHEAVEIAVRDLAGNVLATRAHPRILGKSPQAGDFKQLTLYSAYAADENGRILTDARGDPMPAASAVPIGTISVSNACTAQNLRIALEGFQTFVASLN
ncbi:MAG: hypothetical protein G01um101431_894 [Parcubacteria group bacterium Gr01-1014_31]|nr:MAG: hypothetical protein G01um101431_894 [Parcubacteria group bacterium Gr01-1014_31]